MLRVFGARQPDLLLDDLVGKAKAGGEQGGVIVCPQEFLALEPAADFRTEWLLHGVRPFLGSNDGPVRAGCTQRDPAKTDAFDLQSLQLFEPCLIARRIHRRVAAMITSVAQPQLGILRRILHLPLDDPRVAAAWHPGRDALPPVLAVDVLPIGEQLAKAAAGEVAGRALDDRPTQLVACHAAVAVDETFTWGDHERRVGDEQNEGLAGLT